MMKASDDCVAAAYDGAREGGDGQTGRFARRARSHRHRTGGGTRQYDAFGRTIRQTGEFAEANPFRYSTKYTDDGTSLIYYGKRYYHSAWGRFITRDPAQESGGLNLYGFTGNNGVNRIDYLGLSALVNGHTMDPYGTECTKTVEDMGDQVKVTTDCNDGSAPFTEYFGKHNPGGGGDMFGGDGGITFDTGGLPGIVVTPNTGGDATVVVEEDSSKTDPAHDNKCSELANQLDGNKKLLASFESNFAAGGVYAEHASLLSTSDWLSVGQILIGVGADYGSARYGELATRGIPGQLGTTRYPVGAAQTWGTASKGIAVVGIGMTVWATADAAVDRKGYETANGALNIGAGVYAMTGPIGWAVGGAQGLIGLAQAGWTAHWNNRANESTASAAANQKTNIGRTISRVRGIVQQMEALGCK